jgi:ubiquinone/menaquinone biosynthesis C-methylase UbiE
MLPDLTGKKILDIGCGTGIFTFLLEGYNPLKITGLDISESMLSIAKQKAEQRNLKAAFILGDASYADQYVNEKFDLIFSSTTSHYIENLDRFFGSLKKCMEDDGLVILSIIHPIYTSMYPIEHGDTFPKDEEWRIRYLDKSVRAYIQPWIEYNDKYEKRLSKSYHHLFSDYVKAINKAGLVICQIEEPMPPESWKTDCKGRYEGYIETPAFMIMKLKRCKP